MSTLIKNSSFIGGQWISAKSSFPVHNPATGAAIAQVSNCGASETESAIAAAAAALPNWRASCPGERSSLLRRLYSFIEQHRSELARIMTEEQGKPLREAEREISYGAEYIEWYAEEAKRIYGTSLPAISHKKRITVLREPIGVCAAITPWNFPMAMIARKMAPALAAGCTFIVKPASQTPLSALALAACVEACGFPAGVFNVVTGDAPPIAQALMSSEVVRKLSFTGSTEVGRLLFGQAAPTLKKLTLELGGNAPFIVFDDADLERAVSEAVFAKFRNAGQTCVCANRFLVDANVHDRFLERFAAAMQKLTVGNGMESTTDIGPLIDNKAKIKVSRLVSDALEAGAQLYGGALSSSTDQFFPPCILTGVRSDMAIVQEEIFGPVAAVQKFSNEAEAIELANSTSFGLASYIFTENIRRAERVSRALQFGMVGVNSALISLPEAPFGGIKHSGFGREGGREGIDEYLQLKYLCSNEG